jgi:hypothetical protein
MTTWRRECCSNARNDKGEKKTQSKTRVVGKNNIERMEERNDEGKEEERAEKRENCMKKREG